MLDRFDLRLELDIFGFEFEQGFFMGDEVELTRVMANLVENARKYGKSRSTGVTLLDIAASAKPAPRLVIKNSRRPRGNDGLRLENSLLRCVVFIVRSSCSSMVDGRPVSWCW